MHSLKLLLVSAIFVLCQCENYNELTAYGYHAKIGIPRAKEIFELESNPSSRIVGGVASALAAIPHQSGIIVTLTSGWTSVCGGSLISRTRVLTAAHCWWDGQNQGRMFTIVLGSLTLFSGGTRIETTEVIVHSNWNTNEITHDIAIAKITSVTFTNNIQSIPLPTLNDVNQVFAGLTGIASGYGKTSDAQNSIPTTTSLHQTSLLIITNAVCQNSFSVTLHGSHLCTSGQNGVGTCDGDSGGPLTVIWNNQRILVGIVSFGLANGCQTGYPSVYTRVTSFLTWIQANL